MVTIGVDAHKSIHQALALDDAGTLLGHWRGANTATSWQRDSAGAVGGGQPPQRHPRHRTLGARGA